MTTLGDIGEHEAIRRLAARLGGHPDLRTGVGDDCAVVRLPGSAFDQVLTTDPTIEHVHFLPSDDPFLVGNKAAGRVLSDIAAMGAQPQWLLVDVVARPEHGMEALERIYDGMLTVAARFGAALIGGDLAQGPCLELHVFGIGTVPAGRALLRSGAKPGDAILVSGPLGGSRAGKHLGFVPRVKEGIFLRETGLVHAMMDISDGLATDLRHILAQSGVGALLDANAIPCTATLEGALYDGEDFELLLTVREPDASRLRIGWQERFGSDLYMIGRIDDAAGALRLRMPDGRLRTLGDKAFEHFRN